MEFETLAIHAGQAPDSETGAVMTPIYQTSTYAQDDVGIHRGYEYSRTGNPTRTALESCMAFLEGGKYALAFASGMAASDAVLRLFKPGDHIIAGNDVYGGTYRLFEQVLRPYGLDFTYVDTTDLKAVRASLRPSTRLVWLETPSNPLLHVSDIAAISIILQDQPHKVLLGVDNTFATPYLQQPLVLGADIVVHSTTKYLGGHSDVVGGVVVVKDEELHHQLAFIQNAVGAIPGPLDCFLVLRGIKTLPVRMERHAENASKVVAFLRDHPKVSKVLYPSIGETTQAATARNQMRNGGGMVSFIHLDGPEGALQVARQAKVFTLAESLGGVESLIEIPALMTHASTVDSPIAVDNGLVRLSVGLENENDLLEDLAQALG